MRRILNHLRRGFPLTATSTFLMAVSLTAMTLRAQGQTPAQASGAVVSTVVDVSPEDLRVSPPGANWPSYNGDYSGRRYSSLSQINSADIGQLRAQWVFHVRASNDLEVTPVAVDGILFISAANDVYAVDARAGRSIWHYSR